MKTPKVLVGCPTSSYHEYCLEEYSKAIKSLTYKNYNILLVDNSENEGYIKKLNSLNLSNLSIIKSPYSESAKKRIIDSRNILREQFLNKNYDFLLSLEQDIIPPRNIIEMALSHKKDILSGVYCGNIKVGDKIRILPLVYKYPPKSRFNEAKQLINKTPKLKNLKKETNAPYLDMVKAYYTIEELEKEKPPTKVHSCGLGCVLISRKVLEKVKFRYSKAYSGFDDVWFCEDAKKHNFEIFVDPKIKCKHLLLKRPWNWSDLLKNKA